MTSAMPSRVQIPFKSVFFQTFSSQLISCVNNCAGPSSIQGLSPAFQICVSYIHIHLQGRIQEFLIGGGGGGPNFGSERPVELFCGKLLLPHTPSQQSRLHVIISWPLTVYLNSTRKGCTLGTSSSCAW